MKLSVIVATRNRASSLPGCLQSIAAALAHAAPLDAEIIVVDEWIDGPHRSNRQSMGGPLSLPGATALRTSPRTDRSI